MNKTNRFQLIQNGNAIAWECMDSTPHTAHLEMAGLRCADIVTYGQDAQGLVLCHHPVFPSLRIHPNNTHGSYQMDLPATRLPRLQINGQAIAERLCRVEIDGTLTLFCTAADGTVALRHRCYVSTTLRVSYEAVTVSNRGTEPLALSMDGSTGELNQTMGPMGINILTLQSSFTPQTLAPGQEYTYYLSFHGHVADQSPDTADPQAEYAARREKIAALTAPLQLDTGNEILDSMFRFAKLRAGESVFSTRYGLLHSPGGGSFYAATWCNDQVEYAGPYFAYTGDAVLLQASANAYRMYRPFMSSAYLPIPSSVVAEGLDYWNGVGDRGDAAMYLYGATHFVLTAGDEALARELLPAIEWCAEYCRRKINEKGVIASDADELEHRFPAGDANLCTSTLAYEGYRCAAILEREFGNPSLAQAYQTLSEGLQAHIEAHFGATLHDIPTYRYYEGCEVLRSWICMPLCVGIYTRAQGTVRALTSPYLMRPEGFLTTEGNETIWDRSTLYSLRGIFASGFAQTAFDLLLRYCTIRLLGDNVPYAVEAYPEGGRQQLSGESALFCKVILDGILDLRPEGLHRFSIKPNLPAQLDHLYLRGTAAHGTVFDVFVEKDTFTVTAQDGKVLAQGQNGTQVQITL